MQKHCNLIRNGDFSFYRHSFSNSPTRFHSWVYSFFPSCPILSCSHCRLETFCESFFTTFVIFSIFLLNLLSSICMLLLLIRGQLKACRILTQLALASSSFSLPPPDSLHIRPDGIAVKPKSTGPPVTCCAAPRPVSLMV